MEARVGILFIETCHFFQSSNERIHFIHFDVIKTKCTAYVLLKTSRGERHKKLEKSKKNLTRQNAIQTSTTAVFIFFFFLEQNFGFS